MFCVTSNLIKFFIYENQSESKKRPPTIVERNKKTPIFNARGNMKSSLKIYKAGLMMDFCLHQTTFIGFDIFVLL